MLENSLARLGWQHCAFQYFAATVEFLYQLAFRKKCRRLGADRYLVSSFLSRSAATSDGTLVKYTSFRKYDFARAARMGMISRCQW